MNAGLPGTGIGGLFYIAGALLMPMRRLLDASRRRSDRFSQAAARPRASATGADAVPLRVPVSGSARRPVVRVWPQLLIAVGILSSLWATGWLLGLAFPEHVSTTVRGGPAALPVRSVVRWMAVAGTAGLLLFVLAIVEAARLIGRRLPPATISGKHAVDGEASARQGRALPEVA